MRNTDRTLDCGDLKVGDSHSGFWAANALMSPRTRSVKTERTITARPSQTLCRIVTENDHSAHYKFKGGHDISAVAPT